MITPNQAHARRINGKLSRGPKTQQGKAVSSKNALVHGLFSKCAIIPGESLDDLAAYRASMIESLLPANAVEMTLVETIVVAGWQLRRFPEMAAGILSSGYYQELAEQARTVAEYDPRLNRYDPEDCHDPKQCGAAFARQKEMEAAAQAPEYTLGRAMIRDAREQHAITLVSRYQASVERTFFRSLKQLRRLKLRNEPTELQNPAHVPHNFTAPEPLAC